LLININFSRPKEEPQRYNLCCHHSRECSRSSNYSIFWTNQSRWHTSN